MSEPRDLREPDERRAADAVRSLSASRPEPGYRERLKREFVSGSIALGSRPVESPRAVEVSVREAWRSLLLPAAAGVIVVSALLLNRGPGWEVVTVSGDGMALVNGRAVPLGQTEDVARAIGGGGRVTLPAGASLVIAAPGRMAVEITPETEASLSAPPARWLGRIASAHLKTGEIRVTTGARFHGSKLFVKTPEAAIEVTGTTLAVIREPQGTCVCVMEGEVRVGAPGHSMVPVAAGRLRYLFRDGREPEQAEMRPVEKEKLSEMLHEHASRMGTTH